MIYWIATVVTALFVVPVEPALVQPERPLGPDVRRHAGFATTFLAKPRDIMVWLPPGYEAAGEKRYPVLYLHDGANVYVEWRIDDVAKALIAAGEIEPLLIVFVPNGGAPEDRLDDYTPTRSANIPAGGKADRYNDASFGRRADLMLKFLFAK